MDSRGYNYINSEGDGEMGEIFAALAAMMKSDLHRNEGLCEIDRSMSSKQAKVKPLFLPTPAPFGISPASPASVDFPPPLVPGSQARPKSFRKRFGNEYMKRAKHLGETREQGDFLVEPSHGPLRFQETFPCPLRA